MSIRMIPSSRSPTILSTANDFNSLDSVNILNPHAQVLEVASQPDFYIFTSLVWIRIPDQQSPNRSQLHQTVKVPVSEHESHGVTASDQPQPDLGLLEHHRDRLSAAAEALKWRGIDVLENSECGLDNLRSRITSYIQELSPIPSNRVERRKLRILISRFGKIQLDSTIIDCPLLEDWKLQSSLFVPQTLDLKDATDRRVDCDSQLSNYDSPCQVLVDCRPSQPSIFTTHKTSSRCHYNNARAQVGISTSAPTDKEVILYNQNGEVMEASLCTVYFCRNSQWITPAAICGSNMGVTRRLALERDLCKQGNIEIAELKDGEMIWLSNAVRGFFVGRVCLK